MGRIWAGRSSKITPDQCLVATPDAEGAAARGLTDESDQQVLTVSGKFIAESAKTQRTQRRVYRRPDLGAVRGKRLCCSVASCPPHGPARTDQKFFLCTANLANPRVLRRFSELAWRPEQPAPTQARLNADQQRMALMHADWPQAATAGRGSYRKLSLAALPRHPRSIRAHLRHPPLICVESCLLGARRTIAQERGTARHSAGTMTAGYAQHPWLRPTAALRALRLGGLCDKYTRNS